MSTHLMGMAFRPASDPQVVITSDWPEDAEVINAEWDFNSRTVRLLVASESFDDVPPGVIPPEWSPVFFARHIAGSLMDLFKRMEEEPPDGS